MAQIFPSSLSFSRHPIVSAMGVVDSCQCVWYRSMASTPSRLRLCSTSWRIESGRRQR